MPWKVFHSYSHSDAPLRKELAKFLTPLEQNQKIVQWHDRKIEPGSNWNTEIKDELDAADLILLLVSPDFLASNYCFGVEVDRALTRLKRGEAKVVPILLKPSLWEESRFSELQIIPRDGKPITSWRSQDEAFLSVAKEIAELVKTPPPPIKKAFSEPTPVESASPSLELIRSQVRSYAHLYERIRQRMPPSSERTQRMEEVFQRMRDLALASYPLLEELGESPSPGERLAAVAILQVFASERYLPFLVKLVGSEKPFVGYHATRALRFAVGAVHPRVHPRLLGAIVDAGKTLRDLGVGPRSDRGSTVQAAEQELRELMGSLDAASVETMPNQIGTRSPPSDS
jgi:hypothetical protein